MFELPGPTTLEQLYHPLFLRKGIEVFLKREDQIDEEISGNKWRKLKYNLIRAKASGYQTLVTFGGAFSNHIAATAAAANRFGFNSIGIIRGDELHPNSNPTLQKAQMDGMNFEFVSRSEYKKRDDTNWIKALKDKHQAFIIPEGGSNQLALKGVAELIEEIEIDFDHILCPVGTGGTLAGIIQGLEKHQLAWGVACLKGEKYLHEMVQELAPSTTNWNLIHQYHFGGYAKFDSHLIEFINHFFAETGTPLDPIYTGKMMYGLFDLVKNDKFDGGTRIICIHTGGLQSIAGFNEKHHNNKLKLKL